jgi:hypothetical protein
MEKYNGCMYVATGNMECKQVERFRDCRDVISTTRPGTDVNTVCTMLCEKDKKQRNPTGYNKFGGNWTNSKYSGVNNKGKMIFSSACNCCKQ